MAGSKRARGAAGPNVVAAEIAVLALASAAVAAVYLSIYASRDLRFPVGYDTPKYLWRTALVGAKGISSLAGAAPPPFRSNPDRVGFPVLIGAVSSLLGVSANRLVMVLPAVMAATIGLGAAAFARMTLAMPRWAVCVFVVAVGASANVSRMAGPGYLDNLVVTSVLIAAAVLAVAAAAAANRPALAIGIGAGGLLVAGVLIHWIFVALLAGILLAVALVALPWSLRAWRGGGRPLGTPSGRLGAILGGAAVAGGAALLTLVGSEPSAPRLPVEAFRTKLSNDVPRYGFAVTGPLAAIGVAWAALRLRLGTRGDERGPGMKASRAREPREASLGAWLMLVWAATALVAIALLALGRAIPAHRFLAFDLGIPLLIATGLVAVVRLIAPAAGTRSSGTRRSGARIAVAALVVALALGGTTVIAYRAWSGAVSWIPATQFQQSSVAATYLQRVGGTTPVVFIVDLGGASPTASTSEAFHVIRTALAPEDITRTYEYLGRPEDFLAGRPTLRSDPAFNLASLQHWPSVRAILDQHPIALMMRSFMRGFDASVRAHPEWGLTRTLAVVQGPHPTVPVPPLQPVPRPLGVIALAALWAAFLTVLLIAGGGWAATAARTQWPVRLALAPAFGVAAIVLGGVVADRLGLRLDGAGGAVLIAVVAAAGWTLFAIRRRTPPTVSEGPEPTGRSARTEPPDATE